MHMKRLFTVVLTLLALFYSSIASAQVYRWVDAKGETHFSDQPPKSARHKAKPAAKKAKTTKRKVLKKQRPVSRPVKRKVSSTKRKLRKSKSTVQKTKPRKKRVTRPKQKLRMAKIVRGSKTRQITRSAPKRKVTPKRRTERAAPKTKSVAATAVTAQSAHLLLSSLDATFYDLERTQEQTHATKPPKSKAITNFKKSLCRDNRRHLAVLQEKGFQYYYDEKGELRVAWGVEGFYRQKKRYLSASEVARKTKEVAFEVERYCDDSLDGDAQVKARQNWIRSEYCDVSKVILADLEHPFMRTSEADIKKQEEEVERYCFDYPNNKYRDDERYYPLSLNVERLQQEHFLYR